MGGIQGAGREDRGDRSAGLRTGGNIDMLQKDLSQGRALAAESPIPFPMMAAAREIFVAGQAAGYGRSSQPALFALWHMQGGT